MADRHLLKAMMLDASTGKVLVMVVVAALSVSTVLGSRHQPFPTISGRFGWLLCALTTLLLLSEQAPRPMSLTAMLVLVLGVGSFGVLVGVHHMVRTRRDVFIAPISGFLVCLGAGGLMVQTWPSLNTVEQWSGFLLLVVMGGCQTWMVFRGLLIGRLPMAWSQAGMVALQRGQLDGPHGAVAAFERGWDADEEHLNPMAYVALHRIHLFLEQPDVAQRWGEAFEDAGGDDAVAGEWIDAVHTALRDMGGDGNLFPSFPLREEG